MRERTFIYSGTVICQTAVYNINIHIFELKDTQVFEGGIGGKSESVLFCITIK